MALRRLGADIAVHGTNAPDAARYGAGPGALVSLAGDFRENGVAATVVNAAVEQLGGLDCLINNAGSLEAVATQEGLDVVDRNPPTVLSAFAAVVCLKHRTYGQRQDVPVTLDKQQQVLVDVNELLVAADVARRADDVATVLDAVSLATTTLAPLFLYRTVPFLPAPFISCTSR